MQDDVVINELPQFINIINTNCEEKNRLAAAEIIYNLSKLNCVEELIKHVSS